MNSVFSWKFGTVCLIFVAILGLISIMPSNPIERKTSFIGSETSRTAEADVYDLSRTISEDYECFPLIQAEYAKMCLFNESYISRLIRKNRNHIFDKDSFATLTKLLLDNPDAGNN